MTGFLFLSSSFRYGVGKGVVLSTNGGPMIVFDLLMGHFIKLLTGLPDPEDYTHTRGFCSFRLGIRSTPDDFFCVVPFPVSSRL